MKPTLDFNLTLPFGRYKGMAINQIDDFDYLRWLLRATDLDKWNTLIYPTIREYLARKGELNE